jgi:hypothetical protein
MEVPDHIEWGLVTLLGLVVIEGVALNTSSEVRDSDARDTGLNIRDTRGLNISGGWMLRLLNANNLDRPSRLSRLLRGCSHRLLRDLSGYLLRLRRRSGGVLLLGREEKIGVDEHDQKTHDDGANRSLVEFLGIISHGDSLGTL